MLISRDFKGLQGTFFCKPNPWQEASPPRPPSRNAPGSAGTSRSRPRSSVTGMASWRIMKAKNYWLIDSDTKSFQIIRIFDDIYRIYVMRLFCFIAVNSQSAESLRKKNCDCTGARRTPRMSQTEKKEEAVGLGWSTGYCQTSSMQTNLQESSIVMADSVA